MDQGNLDHVKVWLYDLLDAGYLAEMAMEAFIEGEREGTKKIKEEIEKCFG